MEFYKVIATISLFTFLTSCGSVRTKDPYRPSGKSQKDVTPVTKKARRELKIKFLQDRYNLCTQRRALRAARYEYRKLLDREKKYGNKYTKEKNKYKNIIIETSSRSKIEELRFKKTYKRRIYCTTEEMRHLNI